MICIGSEPSILASAQKVIPSWAITIISIPLPNFQKEKKEQALLFQENDYLVLKVLADD